MVDMVTVMMVPRHIIMFTWFVVFMVVMFVMPTVSNHNMEWVVAVTDFAINITSDAGIGE